MKKFDLGENIVFYTSDNIQHKAVVVGVTEDMKFGIIYLVKTKHGNLVRLTEQEVCSS